MSSISVNCLLGSWMENRNGMPDIIEVNVTSTYEAYESFVSIGASTKRHQLRGGITMDKAAFLELCRKGIEEFA